MKIYKAIFNRIGNRVGGNSVKSSRSSLVTSEMTENRFLLLGDMDYVTVAKETELSNMVKYQNSTEHDGDRIFVDTFFLIDMFNQDMLLMEQKELRQTHLYQLSALKLTSPLLVEGSNYEDLLSTVRNVVAHSLAPFSAKGGKIEVFGTTGAFDVVVLCASTQFSDLLFAQATLREITVSIGDSEQTMFSTCRTYNAISNELQPKKITDEICNSDINIRFINQMPVKEKLLSWLCSSLDKSNDSNRFGIEVVRNSETSDITIRLSNVYFTDLLRMINYTRVTDEYTDWYQTTIFRTVTTVYMECESAKKMKSNIAFLPYPNRARLYDIIHSQYDEMIEKNLIPELVKHDCKVSIDTCLYLLQYSYQPIAGLRFACIIHYAFEIILKRHKSLEPEAIKECLHDLCMFANMAIQTDSIQLCDMDKELVAAGNSVSKFLFSIENLTQKVRTPIIKNGADIKIGLKNGTDILIFLTIGLSYKMESKFYFCSSPGELPKYISINLPNTCFLDIDYSLPYIYHELGHYIGIMDEDKSIRNKAYYKLVKTYIINYVYSIICNHGGELSISDVQRYVESFLSIIEKPNFGSKSFSHYVASLISHMRDCMDEMINMFIAKEQNSTNPFLSAFRSLLDSTGYFYFFDHLFRETHSDVVMVVLGDLNAVEYLKTLFAAMKNDKFVPDENYEFKKEIILPNQDIGMQYRVSAILQLLEPQWDINRYVEELSEEEVDYYYEALMMIEEQSSFLSPLVSYLELVYNRLKQNVQNCVYPPLRKSLPFDRCIEEYMDLWYNNALYWHYQASDIVEGSKDSSQGGEMRATWW